MKTQLIGVVAAAIAVGACGGGTGSSADDDDGHDASPSMLTCMQVHDALHARLLTTSRACGPSETCVVVGEALDTFGGPTCNVGIPFADNCSGAGVNLEAWHSAPVTAELEHEWSTRCAPLGAASGVEQWYDCGRATVACVDSVCVATPFNCFGDAGVR